MAAVLRANSDGNISSFVFVTRLFFFFFFTKVCETRIIFIWNNCLLLKLNYCLFCE